ncbi:hypothetical protein BS17DRAFT_867902 [Gyrodon lividus]|nr:hypothetical protein BS17DRAFT_867902 [Gyrodon lividus]
MNTTAHLISQEPTTLTSTLIKKLATLAWEQRGTHRSKPQEAQKLSTVKCKQPDPKFNQQQQPQQSSQQGGSNGGAPGQNKGKTKHGSKHRNQHKHNHLASIALSTPPMERYPIEMCLSSDPTPEVVPSAKCPCLEEHISTTSFTAEDDAISIASSYDSNDIYNMYIDHWACKGEPGDDTENNNSWQVPFSSLLHQGTNTFANACLDAHNYIAMSSTFVKPCLNDICVHLVAISACAKCKGKIPENKVPTWMLNSRAPIHFTMNKKDFAQYEPLKEKIMVQTANGISTVDKKGTIILQCADEHGHATTVKLHPIYYMPDLNTCLLSMGIFLRENDTISWKYYLSNTVAPYW